MINSPLTAVMEKIDGIIVGMLKRPAKAMYKNGPRTAKTALKAKNRLKVCSLKPIY